VPTIDQIERMLEAEPDDPFLLYALAQEHAKAGATDAAIDAYDRVLAVDPGYSYAYFHRARALEDAGRTDEAVQTLRQGLEAARRAADAHAASEIAAFLEELA
jgi:tetratricopeptide (TPR) repeat protein